MQRCAIDEHAVLAAFRARLDGHPAAGFVVGTAEVDAAACAVTVQIGDVACGPVHLVALASELLGTAAAQVRAAPDAGGTLSLARAIHAARAALALTDAPRAR